MKTNISISSNGLPTVKPSSADGPPAENQRGLTWRQGVLLRQGTHGRGIVASGTVASEIYQAEDALATEALKQQLPETKWDRLQMSGTFLKPELIGKLEELLAEHLSGLPQSDGRFNRGEAAPASVPVTDDLSPRLNPEIGENDVLLFDIGIPLTQHIADLAEAPDTYQPHAHDAR